MCKGEEGVQVPENMQCSGSGDQMSMLGNVQETLQTFIEPGLTFWPGIMVLSPWIQPATAKVSLFHPHIFPSAYRYRSVGRSPLCACAQSSCGWAQADPWAVGKLLWAAWGCRRAAHPTALLLWPAATSGTAHREIFSRPISKSVCALLVELICS